MSSLLTSIRSFTYALHYILVLFCRATGTCANLSLPPASHSSVVLAAKRGFISHQVARPLVANHPSSFGPSIQPLSISLSLALSLASARKARLIISCVTHLHLLCSTFLQPVSHRSRPPTTKNHSTRCACFIAKGSRHGAPSRGHTLPSQRLVHLSHLCDSTSPTPIFIPPAALSTLVKFLQQEAQHAAPPDLLHRHPGEFSGTSGSSAIIHEARSATTLPSQTSLPSTYLPTHLGSQLSQGYRSPLLPHHHRRQEEKQGRCRSNIALQLLQLHPHLSWPISIDCHLQSLPTSTGDVSPGGKSASHHWWEQHTTTKAATPRPHLESPNLVSKARYNAHVLVHVPTPTYLHTNTHTRPSAVGLVVSRLRVVSHQAVILPSLQTAVQTPPT